MIVLVAAVAARRAIALPPVSPARLSDVRTFLSERSFDELQVSPDGSQVAFIVRRNDFDLDRETFELWRIDVLPDGRVSPPTELAELASCSALRWSPDGRRLSYLSAAPGGESQVFSRSASGGSAPTPMTGADRFASGVDLYEWLPDASGIVAIAADEARDTGRPAADAGRGGDVRRLPHSPQRPALFRVALSDGRVERLAAAPFDEPASLAISPDGRRAAVAGSDLRETVDATEAALVPIDSSAGALERTKNSFLEDRVFWVGSRPFTVGMGEERNGRFAVTEPRICRIDPGGGLSRVAPSMPGGIAEVVPLANGSLLTVSSVSTRMRISLVDPDSGRARDLREQRGWIDGLTSSPDGRTIAFVAGDAAHFAEIYVARGPEGVAGARAATEFNAPLSRLPLPEMETVSWKSRDGVEVEGVAFWPPGRRGENGLPLVVDLHGGPFGVARVEAVDLYGPYMSYPALLAARGYLVLNPNYRGSGGRGDAFTQGIQGHLCSLPSDDVITGVETMIERGWADRGRVGLIGYSGGGTLSKCLVGRTGVFRAVATGSGAWNEIAVFGTHLGAFYREIFFGGRSPWEDPRSWREESPNAGLGNVTTPTLIITSEHDAGAAQASEMYYDLLWRGAPVEYLSFPGEAHVFTRPSHKEAKIRAELAWFERYLLGNAAGPPPDAP